MAISQSLLGTRKAHIRNLCPFNMPALVIGGIELISVLAEKLGIVTGPLAAIATLDLSDVGFLMVGLFAVAWVVAIVVWKVGRIEQRWSGA